MKKELISGFVMILLAGFVYAELEPGKLWINGVFIPYSVEEKITCKPKQLLGDANGNGEIETLDASLVLKYIEGLIDFDNIRCADVNCDNQITQEDAQLILQYVAGLIKGFPCDKDPPEITRWSMNPFVGEPGTMFNLIVEANDNSKFKVEAEIEGVDFKFTKIVELLDDGKHNDGDANDGRFGYILDSTEMPEGEYKVYYIATDIYGNTRKTEDMLVYFKIQISRNCKTILDNGDPSEKIDIVFVGDNFKTLEDFYKAVDYQIDLDGDNHGIFSVEPFKSNKDKFNIYLFDQLTNFDCRDVDGIGICEKSLEAKYAAANCPMDLYNIISTNFFRSNAWYGIRTLTSVGETEDEWKNDARTSTHEFGHSFGLLNDEYVEGDRFQYGNWYYKNCYGEKVKLDWDCGFTANCYYDNICVDGCENDPDCLLEATCERDGRPVYDCNPEDPDVTIIREKKSKDEDYATCEKGDLCGEFCKPLDLDCNWATCNKGDECIIGCSPIDPDCGDGKSCKKGDGCLGACNTLDPDCGRATCEQGDGCLFNCEKPDPDCDIFNFKERGYKIGEKEQYVTCNSGDGCVIGCTPIDPDCGDGASCEQGDGCKGGCFYTTTVDNCNQNSQWKDLIGNGCGKDGLIDCNENDENYYLEINCNIGCYYTTKNRLRPNFNSIMRNLMDPFSFASVNEREICREIKDWTGQVENYCTTLCINGCPDGKKCIKGVCQ